MNNGKYDFDLDLKHSNSLSKIIKQIRPNSVVLEFGPANGRMTRYLTEKLGCKVYCVEIDKNSARDASKYAVECLVEDIEGLNWAYTWSNIQFDYVTFADVLEHLHNPQRVLKSTKTILKQDGEVLISVPNLAHNSVILSLIQDKFQYDSVGLLDNTHIHFFTYYSLEEMCKESGFKPIIRDAIYSRVGENEIDVSYSMVSPNIREVMEERYYGEVYQYVYTLQLANWVEENNEITTNYITDCSKNEYKARVYITYDGKEKQIDYKFVVNKELNMEFLLDSYDNLEKIFVSFLDFTGWLKVNEISLDNDASNIDLNNCCSCSFHIGADQFLLSDKNISFCVKNNQINLSRVLKIRIECIDSNISTKAYSELIKFSKLQNASQNINDRLLKLESTDSTMTSLLEKVIQDNCITEERINSIIEKKIGREGVDKAYRELASKIGLIHHTIEDINYSIQNSNWNRKEQKKKKAKKVSLHGIYIGIMRTIYKGVIKVPALRKGLNAIALKIYKIPFFGSHFQQSVISTIDGYYEKNAEKSKDSEKITYSIEEYELPLTNKNHPLVSIIVPCYNHARFLKQRLDSIYGQTYSNYEVILLDDCSTDESEQILSQYAAEHIDNTICCYNEENVGRVFLQWNKGLALAKGELIWIAESDDWCDSDFLAKMVPIFAYQSVMLSFSRSVFMKDGKEIWTTEQYLKDTNFDWMNDFTVSSYEAVQNGFATKNIIPNVSSALFRNIGIIPDEVIDIWKNIRLCGDWIFYLYLIKGGDIHYTNTTKNFYRIHSGSTSKKVQNKIEDYYREEELVSLYIARNYRICKGTFEKTQETLRKHYLDNKFGSNPNDIDKWYDVDKIYAENKKRKKNVLMCNFAMKIGGGEILPIHLANELRKKGLSITFIDCRMDEFNPIVREMLNPDIPFIELKEPLDIRKVVSVYGIEIVHSHHGSVDKLVADYLREFGIVQIITLHGMYEAIDKMDLKSLLNSVGKRCSAFAYISDKNLVPFKENELYDSNRFVKVRNGLIEGCPDPIDRNLLSISEESFVICLVSRALIEKGWVEACNAVIDANKSSVRPIHIVLVGDGAALSLVRKIHSKFIHPVGAKSNPRAYFAMSDMGILPSYYSGESFPLTVIECLMCGRPVIATDIGEISYQLRDNNNELAGILLPLSNGKINVQQLSEELVSVANDTIYYEKLKKRALPAASKFSISKVADDYIKIYQKENISI